MSLCDQIPSILDVFEVNFETYMKNIYIASINGEIFKLSRKLLVMIYEGQRDKLKPFNQRSTTEK